MPRRCHLNLLFRLINEGSFNAMQLLQAEAYREGDQFGWMRRLKAGMLS